MTKITKPVLIVSTGRTGTKFFARFFDAHYPQVEAHHTTPYSTLINVLSNAYLAGVCPKAVIDGLWRWLKKTELTQCQRDFYIDSNNHLYALIVHSPNLYPGLKVVHIVRDPRSYVRSHWNWARSRRKSYIANYLLPFWQPNPFLLREMSLAKTVSQSMFDRFCWVWDFKNRYIEKLNNSDIPYLRFRFEDIFDPASGNNCFHQLLKFIGLPNSQNFTSEISQPINETKERVLTDWHQWSPMECARLDEICGSRMVHYGYGKEKEWIEKVKMGRSFL